MRAAGLLLAAALLLAGCAGRAPRPAGPDPGTELAARAVALVGTPYQFGGADAGGFDCSGLAFYVHEQSGILIPRSAAGQQQAARPVALEKISPGDLLFFRIAGEGVDHVGIYLGGQRFVHAPRAGAAVRIASLGSGFYVAHLVSAGRFWRAP
ncbi:MAG: C40 family peptidase [Gammaproteobacteria bacterium]|nr:C40 family peptidase [Gammaproteobacteria bacterium]MBV9696937.1 C40 family peptidase [Gammaproteobacteria bacterium]